MKEENKMTVIDIEVELNGEKVVVSIGKKTEQDHPYYQENVNFQEQADRIVACRIAMLEKFPFWGHLVTRLKMTEKLWAITAFTDGKIIGYDPYFIAKLTMKQIVYLLGHEVLHAAFDHLGRGNFGSKKERQMLGIAADFDVNKICIKEKMGDPIGRQIRLADLCDPETYKTFFAAKPKELFYLHDEKYDGWAFEEIYEDLLKHEQQMKDAASCGGKQGEMGLEEFLDMVDKEHPDLPEEERQELRNKMRQAIMQAAEVCKNGAANIPSEFQRMIDGWTESKIDWRQYITSKIQSQITSDFTYARLGRRSFSGQFVFPARTKEPCISVDIAIDASGSISTDDMKVFLGEVNGIMSQFRDFRLGVFSFDTVVYNYKVFTTENSHELMDYVVVGCGGTDFSAIFDFLKEMNHTPELLVVMTDMGTYDWGDPNYCDAVFLNYCGGDSKAPYGVTIKY